MTTKENSHENEYEVGYRKPPKANQFQSGQSGNLSGRPKHSKNMKTDLQEELYDLVQVNSGGKSRTVSKQRAMLMRAVEKAINGDVRAMEYVTKLVHHLLTDAGDTAHSMPLSQEEEALFRDLMGQGQNGSSTGDEKT